MVQGSRLGGRLLQVCHLFQLQLHFYHRYLGSSSGRLRISIMGSVTNITKELFVTEKTPPSLMA